jgi:UDP-N-acetylmuramoyl-tripeptide--D-alanyl-D-alanine ligase
VAIPLNWYYYAIDVLSVIFIYIMFRHILSRSLFFLQIFQQKGYKAKEYYAWTRTHYTSIVHPVSKSLMSILVVVLSWYRESITPSAATVIIVILVLFWYSFDSRYNRDQSKKPLAYTPRLIRLLTVNAVFIFGLPLAGTFYMFMRTEFLFDIYGLALVWVFADILVPYLLFLSARILLPVEESIQQGFIRKAKQKLERIPHIKIIAITGSYGKTSTKFILRDILKQRYNVCSTPGSYNTPMGITKVINEDLDASHELLILEMGARYPGNIDELCDIARPDISVVTNVGIAHLETFGSVDVIRETKEAIVRRVAPGGLVVLNADNEQVMKMNVRDDCSRITVGLASGDIQARDLHYDQEGCSFIVTLPDGTEGHVKTRLLGAHNVQNILQGIAVGAHLGIRLATMIHAIKDIEPVEHRLELKKQGSIIIIDDAFNSNPVGAANAVSVLSQFKTGRRVIVTPGMVELGELEEQENVAFGEAIGRANLDWIILVGPERSKPIKEGILAAGEQAEKITVVKTLFEANNLLKEWLQAGDVVLYENDLPDTYNE